MLGRILLRFCSQYPIGNKVLQKNLTCTFSSQTGLRSSTSSTKKTKEKGDGESFFQNRVKYVEDAKLKGINAYAYNFKTSHSAKDILHKYEHLSPGQQLEEPVSFGGRVMRIRKHSKKLRFFDVLDKGVYIQIVCSAGAYDSSCNMEEDCGRISVGDIVGINGYPIRTPAGELSVKASKLCSLTPCLRLLPSIHSGLLDQQKCHRQRYLDLIFNKKSTEKFLIRAKIIKYLRDYFDDRGFIEVETPILSEVASGAAATPFKTFHTSLQKDLFLRIAPELYLKTLIIGGMDKVFEIGSVFRNEGISDQHNPEFTICEFYEAYADYLDVLKLTENLISNLVLHLFKSFEVEYDLESSNTKINFKPPFNKIEFIPALEDSLNKKFPDIKELFTVDGKKFITSLCNEHKMNYEPNNSASKLLDKLFTHFVIRERCMNPTFVLHHPLPMSPLAKSHRQNPWLSERFELYVAGMEVCNAYTELNDPTEQRKRFEEQQREKLDGNAEVVIQDDNFCYALEYGMPPTAGWGLGIDRLTMILTNSFNIKNVILFPQLR